MPTPVYRFAPSPNGYLHLGHALSALLNFEMARVQNDGRFLLRIEDIDETRCRPDYERAVYDDLAWLGVCWEKPVRRQHDHFDDYRAALDRLQTLGLVYPSFESRAEIAASVAARGATWPRDPDGAPLYPGTARALTPSERARRMATGAPFALRLDMASAIARAGALSWTETEAGPHDAAREARRVPADPAAWGDIVLARKDIPTSYHLSVVVDDAAQGITHVVRGQDLLPATSVHRLLQKLLDLPEPVYHHHRLIRDARGHKLAKSSRATGLRELRNQGATPADIRRIVGLM